MSVGAWDHLLFLATIALAYQPAQWRKWILLATIFAIGHTAALIALTYKVVPLHMAWVEPAIAASIVVLAAIDFYGLRSASATGNSGLNRSIGHNPFIVSSTQQRVLVFLVLAFGFVHGLGFGSNFVPMLMSDLGASALTLSLLAFTLGVETAQVLILLAYWVVAMLVFELWQYRPLLLRRLSLMAIGLAGASLFVIKLIS